MDGSSVGKAAGRLDFEGGAALDDRWEGYYAIFEYSNCGIVGLRIFLSKLEKCTK